ncbi:hypothetical protein Bca52824_008734 [Brassica carinata]|uniref:Fe2OG dioxygenase domain-containing protein n=1 Tax=Brassica carinata TaxID=52824 RepID=A0A8X7WAF9_BRACI|nr:hypothetical protein Bca52824_008734 [Brassica carinata]
MAETPASPPINGSVPAPLLLSDSAAKDVMISWFRGEFAAANAIIDELCGHLMQVSGSEGEEYEGVMAAIHRRRMNWIPLLQMQKYHPISQVTLQLQTATAAKINNNNKLIMIDSILDDDSPTSDITDSGSREEERVEEEEGMTICCKHEEECESRASSLIKQSKRFSAKEHQTNVVKGLKLYEHVFTGTQLSKLSDYVNGLREAGRNQELPGNSLIFPNAGETFVLFNKNTKGTKRELIQLGIPIFGNTTDEHSVVAPIPTLLESVIDHLLQWRLIPEYKRPNGCVINFFDEEEHSQPFQKPPHLDQPISTLVLSELTMVFGHRFGVDSDGNFRGSLTLPLKEGSLLVMRGNSANMARHVMCPSLNKRVAITFFKLKPDSSKAQPPLTMNHVTMWRQGTPAPPVLNPFGMVRGAPLVMLAPAPKRLDAGTGVFLPWTPPVSRKPTKHLPPRVQRLRLLSSAAKSVADREATSSPEVGVS